MRAAHVSAGTPCFSRTAATRGSSGRPGWAARPEETTEQRPAGTFAWNRAAAIGLRHRFPMQTMCKVNSGAGQGPGTASLGQRPVAVCERDVSLGPPFIWFVWHA